MSERAAIKEKPQGASKKQIAVTVIFIIVTFYVASALPNPQAVQEDGMTAIISSN